MSKTVRFVITGETALIMHQDNIDGQTKIARWRNRMERVSQAPTANTDAPDVDPEMQILTWKTRGDDRVPAWTWTTYLYHDGSHIALPSANIQSAICKAAGRIADPNGRTKNKSLKNEAVSCVVFNDEFPQFTINGDKVPVGPFLDLEEIDDGNRIDEHRTVCERYGFTIFIVRASIGGSKHVRVRPKFAAGTWAITGTLDLLDESKLSKKQLQDVFDVAGQVVGLGDWRPGSPKKPGPYGKFTCELK